MKMEKLLVWVACMVLAGSCKEKAQRSGVLEGRIKRETISVTTKIPGKVKEIYVVEGQEVGRDSVLIELDIPEIAPKRQQAKGAVTAAKAQYEMAVKGATDNQIKQLEAKQRGLAEQYEFARKSIDRLNQLLKDSMIAPQRYDEAYAKFQGAKAQLDAVNAELEDARRGARKEMKEAAKGQEQRALGALEEVEVASGERLLRAPDAMTVETITLRKGELATPGYVIVNGYLSGSTFFRFTIPESKIAAYQQGQQVSLSIPYNNQRITGKIIAIRQLARYADITSAYPDYEMSEAIYELKVRPDDQSLAATLLVNATAILETK